MPLAKGSEGSEAGSSSFCQFLQEKVWVVDLEEHDHDPEKYSGLILPVWLRAIPRAWLIIPLVQSRQLFGFIVLAEPRSAVKLNWEVFDLLKVAGNQAVSYLAQHEAANALLVARQFESFNRMSAFVVHDLKNLVAQLSLLLSNAEKHKKNPEFQEDMIETVYLSVQKMKRLLEKLSSRGAIEIASLLSMDKLLQEAVAGKSMHEPVPVLEIRHAGLMVFANQNHDNAVKAIGMGAYDFHQKPCDPEVLALVVERAFYLHALQQENRELLQSREDFPMPGVITRDPGMSKVCRNIEKVAPSDATVLLLGDSGTGKEVLAKALHSFSARQPKRFLAINCAAIPEALLESELFGYEKGAYTGAVKQTLGKIELANGGTFFLDEVGDLPMPLQAKLLRFLQERVIERIGGREEIPVDVRIVCATHQNLAKLIEEGRFREDLYYRLSEIVIDIPPLRDRVGDAALLAHHFKNRFCADEKRSSLNFSQEALAAIENHSWPGNIREMENCIKRAVIMADGSQIGVDDLGLKACVTQSEPINLRQVREEAECKALMRALARVDGNVVRAAELLGVSRPTIYDLMSRHGLK